MKGYMGKILFVDLTSRTHWERDLPDSMPGALIGGKGFGIKLLYDLLPPGTDPLDPANPLVFVSGPLTGTSAPSMRGCLVSKAPLNGMFDDSYFGGHFIQEVKYAGYDAIVVIGKAYSPVYLVISDDRVEFRDAAHLWGLDTYETCSSVKAGLGDAMSRVCCIGPAGENLVKFALVDFEPHRQAGRGGLGAVFGSKNLKAVAVRGDKGIEVAYPESFNEVVSQAHKELADSGDTQEFAKYSSVSLLPFSNELGFLPVRNFQDGSTPQAESMNAAAHESRVWMRHWACAGCPIHCGKMGMIKRGPYAGAICDNVEYESVGLIGGNLAVSSVEAMAFINQTCDKLGLDTISTGGVIGFAIEAYERGLIDEASIGGLPLSFGDHKSILELIHQIAHREGLGDLLADGVVKAAERLGNGTSSFACAIQGLETPAWGPRGSAGMGLAYITGDRGGCHQRGFPIGYETSGSWPKGEMADGWRLDGKGELVSWEQNLLAALYSLTICEFGRSGISYDTYRSMLAAATGLSLSEEEFLLVGERIWNLIRLFNLREGWTQDQAGVPQRFKEALPSGVMKGHAFSDEDIAALLEQYNAARGWDDSGRPTSRTLGRLGVDELMEPLFEGK